MKYFIQFSLSVSLALAGPAKPRPASPAGSVSSTDSWTPLSDNGYDVRSLGGSISDRQSDYITSGSEDGSENGDARSEASYESHSSATSGATSASGGTQKLITKSQFGLKI